MYRTELDVYCKRHNLEVVETYNTWGESGHHERAIVTTSTGERQYLYYDRSRRRPKTYPKRDPTDFDFPPLPKQRGWRNTTLDNRKRAIRMTARAEENRLIRQQDAEPGCNGLCQPELCLYEGTCPIHGANAMLEGLEDVPEGKETNGRTTVD